MAFKITRVSQLKQQAKFNAKRKVNLYNPDVKDFSIFFIGDNTHYLFKAHEIQEFPYFASEYIKTQLTNHLMNKRGLGIITPDQRKAIEKEIEVKL